MRRLTALAILLALVTISSPAFASHYASSSTLEGQQTANFETGGCNELWIWIDSAEDAYLDLHATGLRSTTKAIGRGIPMVVTGSTNVGDAMVGPIGGIFRNFSMFNDNAKGIGNILKYRVLCIVK